jgi:16S rRNA (uracil1498-N3)-methyltransferase
MPLTLESYLGDPAPAARIMLVEPALGIETEPLSALSTRAPQDAALLVGPEGGWTTGECEAARAAGTRFVTLGPRTLRADAVPVVAISLLQYLWSNS